MPADASRAAFALTRRTRCAALVDYFDFVSRVNTVVVTARTLTETLDDPALHKFAAHLLALLHVRIAAPQRAHAFASVHARRVLTRGWARSKR